ncbi:MAG: hypothetical protein ACOCXJ_08705, partial [Planctomycetota bacterium]
RARPVLRTLAFDPDRDWTMADLLARLPQLTRATLRRALDDLARLDLVISPRTGRGRAARLYRLAEPVTQEHCGSSIRLLDQAVDTTSTRYWPIGQAVANRVANISDVEAKAYA